MRSRSLRSTTWTLAAALAAGALLLACDHDGDGPAEPRGQLAIDCSTSSGTVVAGSGSVVAVTALVARDGVPASGQVVVFTSTIGDVRPDVVQTGADGRAVAFLTAPSSPGTAVIGARVFAASPEGSVATTCSVTATGATDPRVSIVVVSPPSVAGLSIQVSYDPTEVTLPSGAVTPRGALAAADCFFRADDDGAGLVRVTAACPTLRAVGGSEVARLEFESQGGVLSAGDFAVTCTGVDAESTRLLTTCTASVTQL